MHINTNEQTGDILKRWRKARRMSQMDLAFSAGVSTRHLSFVETGRARPSDDLILRLAEALQLPLRHTNALLVAAGFAPRYTQWSLDDDQTGMVRVALDHLLTQHDPFPAIVLDRTYDIVMANNGFLRLGAWLADGDDLLAGYSNLFRLMFFGLRPFFVDWEVVRSTMLKRLHEESIAYQSEPLRELYRECIAVTGEAEPVAFDAQFPVLTFALRKDGCELRFFSTVTTFGTAIDVTIQELRIETLFPADAETRQFFEGHGA